MFAITTTLLLGGVGVAVDMNQMTASKQKLTDVVDATALNAAIYARDNRRERQQAGKDFFNGQMAFYPKLKSNGQPVIVFDDATGEVTVTASASFPNFFMGMFGHEIANVSADSVASYSVDTIAPISIAFAFDTSGSMGSPTSDGDIKINALEAATGELFDALFEASKNSILLSQKLSTAFSTYNTDLVINDPMILGHEQILTTMTTDPLFIASGGTNSAPSMQFALDQLLAKKATEGSSNWTGHIVFMTDGINNASSSDDETKDICRQAKDEGFAIYTIAFEAPSQGRALLKDCASDKRNAFDSRDARKLKRAFRVIGSEIGESIIRIKRS